MSGNFTQRGEIAVMDKYTRATHAIKAGADAVIELPTVFATANAEIFAKGAIKLINCCGGEKHICFGTESGEKTNCSPPPPLFWKKAANSKNSIKKN